MLLKWEPSRPPSAGTNHQKIQNAFIGKASSNFVRQSNQKILTKDIKNSKQQSLQESTITIVKMIIAYAQAQISLKTAIRCQISKIRCKEKKLLTVVKYIERV
jgi:hypothetical protein